MAKIELVNVNKVIKEESMVSSWNQFLARWFPSRVADDTQKKGAFEIKNVNLTVPDGKTMVILGPSGCGKTTLLRIIAGLASADSGEVLYDDIEMGNTPPKDRQIGMVFQNYALYPNFTVKDNILAHYLFQKQTPELDEIAREKFFKTSELLGVEVKNLLGRMPEQLSGGEKQRVALGRCITRDPVLFLLDEPLSNLDPKMREKYRVNLKRLLQYFDLTSIYVTHDQQEALTLGDLLAIMKDGGIEQQGSFEDIYRRPRNIFVAEFINLEPDTPAINLIHGVNVSTEFADKTIGVRPEEIEIFPEEQDGAILARISDSFNISVKKVTILEVNLYEDFISARVPIGLNIPRSGQVWLRLKDFHVFDQHNGIRLESVTAS